MLDVIRELLRDANHFSIAVSFLRYSGLGLLVDELTDFFERGGTGQILTSTYLGITQPEALQTLLGFASLECRLHIAGSVRLVPAVPVTGFHSKLYVFRSQAESCVIGSSNFTKGGLASNIESNLRCNEPSGASAASKAFMELWRRDDVVPLSSPLIAAYAAGLSRLAPAQPTFANCVPFTFNPGDLALPPDQSIEAAGTNAASSAIRIAPNTAQSEALSRLTALRACGERRAAVIAAPGIGKTFLAAFDAASISAKTVLFISHRLEHLSQAMRTFEQIFMTTRTYGRLYEGIDESQADFVFSTVVSARNSTTLPARHFDYVVIDEFHHASSDSYRTLLARLKLTFMLGLTATPERRDGHDVLELCDWNVAYEIRLVEAINRGWLLPFHYFGISDKCVDYTAIPWKSGRFDPEQLEIALMLETRVSQILHHAHQKGFDGPKRTTVGFCAGVRHANFMANALSNRGYHAVAVTGSDSLEHREAVYRRFSDPNDPLEWIFVADVLNEGVDIPCINSLLFLRPTESATIFIQQLGRGLRLSADCEVLTVLDFVGHDRAAWIAIQALNDKDSQGGPSSLAELNVTPPRNCEIVFDLQTMKIMQKVANHTNNRRDQCLAAYAALKTTVERPMPLDLWGRNDMPSLQMVRSVYGSWIGLRVAADDAQEWERNLAKESFFADSWLLLSKTGSSQGYMRTDYFGAYAVGQRRIKTQDMRSFGSDSRGGRLSISRCKTQRLGRHFAKRYRSRFRTVSFVRTLCTPCRVPN